MTDLTLLHSPSALYLPQTKEPGLRFTLNRPFLPTPPVVTVQMVDTGSPPPPPVVVQDDALLSPPRPNSRSKKPAALPPPRSSSAPLGRPSGTGTSRTVHPPDRAFPRPKTPDFASGPRRNPIPAVVRPPTTISRPKPFWRNTQRSAVTGTSYASSLHPIRRSTFIAAGLRFDKPVADLSALGVESRIGIVVLLPDSIS
ncbi:hypothetical protein F5148DRAFT_1285673 [Russula earlei]|uniref:Uncharacterized protein n=1 Tax=Russula earlei TaxID=71964 RepID=A0ACC0U5T1_9AGAM|nr:hypothetical protein F5148DRAFT_1285673 [Russula earlei]